MDGTVLPTRCPDPNCQSRRENVRVRFEPERPGVWRCWHCGEIVSHSSGTAPPKSFSPTMDASGFAVSGRLELPRAGRENAR